MQKKHMQNNHIPPNNMPPNNMPPNNMPPNGWQLPPQPPQRRWQEHKIWRVIYPLLLYYGLQIVMTIGLMVLYMLPRAEQFLADPMSMYEFQNELLNGPFVIEVTGLVALFGIPVFMLFLFLDMRAYPEMSEKRGSVRFLKRPHWWVLIIATSFLIAGGIENLIYLTGLPDIFTGYNELAELIFGKTPIWEQILLVGIAGPILEELLMRGLVYKRLRRLTGPGWAALISSAIFGVIHGNVVQGIFAFSFGLYMAYLYEEQGTLLAPILSHVFNNTLAAFATQYGWDLNFGIAADNTIGLIVMTAAKLAVAAVLVIAMDKLVRRTLIAKVKPNNEMKVGE
ncbi:MAG: CPBP family intramembrane metalloprotease [Eubacteriales bacterium]|nr:CPBP family intramembrane metalloprotease [Eubacteriales bacterium]